LSQDGGLLIYAVTVENVVCVIRSCVAIKI